jgi:hypothetical protein
MNIKRLKETKGLMWVLAYAHDIPDQGELVVIAASEFDAFIAAHNRLAYEASRVADVAFDLDLAEAIEDLRELEERQ